MTGYQKLKRENELLWAELQTALSEAYRWDAGNTKEHVEKQLAWIKWKIENETNQEKN